MVARRNCRTGAFLSAEVAWPSPCSSEGMIKWLCLTAALAIAVFSVMPPIVQDAGYHSFADSRMMFGIPNFFNVLSNVSFLLVALLGMRAARGEELAHWVVLTGSAAVGLGSSYYHWNPCDATLFWDRLPMAIVFMAMVAIAAGGGMTRVLLFPLIALGIASVLSWRATGDLRLYVLVQFGSMAAVVAMLLVSPSTTPQSRALWWTLALYGVAKVLELTDHQMALVLSTGGHPWKHVVAAGAIYVYVRATQHRDTNVTLFG